MEMPQFKKTIVIKGCPVEISTERKAIQRIRMCANQVYKLEIVILVWNVEGFTPEEITDEFFTLPLEKEDREELKKLKEKINLFNMLQVRKLEYTL